MTSEKMMINDNSFENNRFVFFFVRSLIPQGCPCMGKLRMQSKEIRVCKCSTTHKCGVRYIFEIYVKKIT